LCVHDKFWVKVQLEPQEPGVRFYVDCQSVTPAAARTAAPPRSLHRVAPDSFELQETVLHGHRVAYRMAGSGPVIVLIHGVTSTSATWERVAPYLATQFTVVAPDLLGHGGSAKPRGDYSLGAYASGVRDLMISLGHERATFVGHSLGGGVAMQLAYQFPERCERLALVDSGGLGREVNLLLRAATLPGSEVVLPLLASTRVLDAGRAVGRFVGRIGLRVGTDIEEMAHGHASLADPAARSAFVHTLRAIVDPSGQRVSALDRLYLAENVPFLIVWGGRDNIIPIEHGHAAHELVPSSRLEVFEGAGHFPHLDDPQRFIDVLESFIDSTEAARIKAEEIRRMLEAGATEATR
jgi:pimeloyl-ACP methyl ester carboxylesterase